MGKFDTHGGYFAPDNYIRVNEGGSHDENPYGGVQMGIDPEGVPNMVEEDESVYDDYVFSDNITVDKEMQEKHLLPRWAVGKLYSAVVDRLVSEAEERGNDPISNKGLEAMLGRCRDAQEEQKALQEQRELEDELSQLSPEELDQLEAMLAQQGQAPQGEMMPQEQMVSEEQMMGPAEPMSQEAMAMPGQEQIPMMANGGFIRTFQDGGGKKKQNWFTRASLNAMMADSPAVATASGWVSTPGGEVVQTDQDTEGAARLRESLSEIASMPMYELGLGAIGEAYRAMRGLQTAEEIIDQANRTVRAAKSIANGEKAVGATKAAISAAKESKNAAKAGVEIAESGASAARNAIREAAVDLTNATTAKARRAAGKKIAEATKKLINAEQNIATQSSEARSAAWDIVGNKIKQGAQAAWYGLPKATSWLRYPLQIAAPLSAGAAIQGSFGYGTSDQYHPSPLLPDVQTAQPIQENVSSLPLPSDVGSPSDTLVVTDDDMNFPDNPVILPNQGKQSIDRGSIDPFEDSMYHAYGGPINRFDGLARYSGRIRRPAIAGFSPYSAYPIDESVFDVPLAPEPDYGSLLAPVAPSEGDIFNAINGYNRGSYEDFMNTVTNYLPSRTRGGVEGKYQIDRAFNPYLHGNIDVTALEHDPRFTAFTDLAVQEAAKGNRRALMYLAKLDEGVADWTKRLFDENGKLKSNFEQIYRDRRKDGLEGIYHLIPNINSAEELAGFFDEPNLAPLVNPRERANGLLDAFRKRPAVSSGVQLDDDVDKVDLDNLDDDAQIKGNLNDIRNAMPYLSTLPRYFGALNAGALGLYNAFQRPDRYTIPHYNPVLPQGQLHLTDPVYNPLDQEQAAQSVLASNAGTNRQIMNSGIGPSVGATLLASDYNSGQNLGNARQAVWDANNQRRNAVLAGRNQNATALANFDYGQSRDRAGILNEAAIRNMQNDLIRQRLNYDAESQKYAALQSNLDSVSQALAGIGQENRNLNALNTNNALYHFLSPNGVAAYKAWEKDDDDTTRNAKCGGKIKRKK